MLFTALPSKQGKPKQITRFSLFSLNHIFGSTQWKQSCTWLKGVRNKVGDHPWWRRNYFCSWLLSFYQLFVSCLVDSRGRGVKFLGCWYYGGGFVVWVVFDGGVVSIKKILFLRRGFYDWLMTDGYRGARGEGTKRSLSLFLSFLGLGLGLGLGLACFSVGLVWLRLQCVGHYNVFILNCRGCTTLLQK